MAEAAKNAAKMLREYETVFLLKPDLTDDNVDKLKERVRTIVNREGGKHLRFTVWGKKRTMYPVAKQPRAIYVHSHYLGGSNLVAEVERNLRNYDEVTRFLSVKIAEEIDPDSRQVLEDVKMAGDTDAPERPGAEREGGFRTPEFRPDEDAVIEDEPAEEV